MEKIPFRRGLLADCISDTVMDARAQGHSAADLEAIRSMTKSYDITTIDGDGIGPEVCQSAVAVLREACGSRLRFDAQPGGAAHYLRGELATDTLVVTRKGVERVARFAFDLSRRRSGAPRDGQRRVTVCDKANILRSYAFFRAVFDEVGAAYPDVQRDYAYADAITVHMLKKPDFYDVIVAENMFGDIISDLGAGTVGGLGIAASAELGENHGLFQGAHGSAPDIAGQNLASPVATVLSGAMMLRWLAGWRIGMATRRWGRMQLGWSGRWKACWPKASPCRGIWGVTLAVRR